jgi:hypothetical protein
MANTYTLISSNVLSTTATSVTFSSIPSTYTDLVLRWSARNSSSGAFRFVINNNTSAIYSRTRVYGIGSSALSSRTSSAANWATYDGANPSTYTANTFTSGEIYLPNYAGSANKVASVFNVSENNSTTDWAVVADADLMLSTAAITEIRAELSAGNLVAGSSFYLYGIKNS